MEIDINDFITKVRAMREAQKQFYRWKHQSDLKTAMRLEMQIDTILKEAKQMIKVPALQKGLFQDDEIRF